VGKNWGSVVAGSFANAFLRIPANIIELFICHSDSYCARCGQFCANNCNWCISFFELIRTDSYSYINIFGTPYCDAGRECGKICENSHHFIGFQSAMRNFRIVAGVVLVALSLLLGYLILAVRVQTVNLWFAIDLFVIIIGSMSFFASIHASVAEGIQTSFLVEAFLSSGYDYMQKCIPVNMGLFSLSGRSCRRWRRRGRTGTGRDISSSLASYSTLTFHADHQKLFFVMML